MLFFNNINYFPVEASGSRGALSDRGSDARLGIGACFAAVFLTVAAGTGLAHAQTSPGDSATGAKVFDARCKMCHSVTADRKNGLGPGLYGVFGDKAAAVPGFSYSPALKASGMTWTPAALDPWLTAPAKAVPGSKMIMAPITDSRTRADLIAYLRDQGPNRPRKRGPAGKRDLGPHQSMRK